MITSDRKYYRIATDSPVMDVIRRAEEKHKAFREAMDAFKKEIGAASLWAWNGAGFSGATFDGDPPGGWRKSAKREGCVPNKRTAAGRKVAARVKELPTGVDSWCFSDMVSAALDGEYTCWGDGHVIFTFYETLGDVHVLSVPAQVKADPPGCAELKMSEYYALREAAEARLEDVA